MKILFFAIAALTITTANAASVLTDVEIQINGVDRNTLMTHAKSTAVIQAIDKLPTVIWGEQHLMDEKFSEDIKAIGFAQADVKVLVEKYDLTRNTLSLKAQVSWDEAKMLSMLKSVQEGEAAKKRVREITSLIDSIKVEDHLSKDSYKKLIEARLLASPLVTGESLVNAHQIYQTTLNQMLDLRRQLVLHYISSIQVSAIGFEDNYALYDVLFPSLESLDLEFETDDLQRFYQQNQNQINAESWCYLTDGQLAISQTCDLKNNQTHSHACPVYIPGKPFNTKLRVQPSEGILKGDIKPVYFVPCLKKDRKIGDVSKLKN